MSRPLSEVRREAEDALAKLERSPGTYDFYSSAWRVAECLRALLAASAPAAGEREEKPCGCFAPDGDACHRHARPESTPMQISGMHDTCDWCQREIPDGCYGVLCSECDTKAHNALPAPPPRPAQDAVREAAERLRQAVHEYNDGCRVGDPYTMDCAVRLLAALDAVAGEVKGVNP